MMNIIMMGPQGSGKSTQAELLAEQLGMAHLEAGELLHYLSQAATPQGRAIKKIMASGQLVGDELMVKIIKQRLAEPQYQNGFVLDGFFAVSFFCQFGGTFKEPTKHLQTTLSRPPRG